MFNVADQIQHNLELVGTKSSTVAPKQPFSNGSKQNDVQLRDVPWHTGLDKQLLGMGANIALGVAAG